MNDGHSISYPGDDGSEPEDIRQEKTAIYAQQVMRRADDMARGKILTLAETTFSHRPYPVAEIKNVFRSDSFEAMRRDWPDMTDAKSFSKSAYKRSISMRTDKKTFQRITREVPVWRKLANHIETPEFIHSIMDMLDQNEVDIGISKAIPVKYRSPLNRIRRPLARLMKRNYLSARMEFSAMPSDGGHITPHTDMPSKIMTIVINIDGVEDGFVGGTSIVEPKDERKIHNPSNDYLGFDEVKELRRVDFKRNCGLFFIRTDNSWHCVFPISGPPDDYRRSININIERIR